MSKVQANTISIGAYCKFNNQLCKVIEKDFTKPGKGHAYVQITFKAVKGNKNKLNHKFVSDDVIETFYVTKQKFVFSYEEKNVITLFEEADPSNTIDLSKNMIDEQDFEYLKAFGQENAIYIEFIENEIVSIMFDISVKTTVSWAESYMKGQTASAIYKKAKIANDQYEINVPTYIEKGDEIFVDLYHEKGIVFLKRII